MKILYDYQAFMQKFGGISNCFIQLISHLPKDVQFEIAVQESDNYHLRSSGLKEIKPLRIVEENFISTKKFKGRGSLYRNFNKFFPQHTSEGRNKLCSIEALKRGDFDVFHPTFFDDYFLPYLNSKPYVLTVHDMIPELFWGNRKKDVQISNKPKLCKKASHIIAVSEKTKEDLIELLDVPENKITVIYHGAPPKIDISTEEPIIEGEYILYVGMRNLYKSFREMLLHIAPVLKRHHNLKIVCTGKDFTKEENVLILHLGLNDKIIIKHPNDHEMQNLYHNALCFICPSQYEGFGIPILEAYQANCPVLLNQKSCFPEIAQDAAIFFHLDQESSNLEDVMEQFLITSKEERGKLIAKQQVRLQLFSWEKSAKQLANVYNLVRDSIK